MKKLLQQVKATRVLSAEHEMLALLDKNPPLSTFLPFVRTMTFWPMCFQDILRVNAARVQDPEIKKVVDAHMAEDAGHDRWFLEDLRLCEGALLDVEQIFSAEYAPIRDACFELMAGVLSATSDYQRLALIELYEMHAEVVLPQVVAYLRRAGVVERFRYFGQHHIEIEAAHSVHEESTTSFLDNVTLDDAERAECLALVAAANDSMLKIFDAEAEILRSAATDEYYEKQATAILGA